MPQIPLNVELIAYTPEPEKWVAMASRTCYSAMNIEKLRHKSDVADNAAYIRGVLASGHTSVIEHVSFTFAIEGVSRALLAQITRHRLASFSVQSQRYVRMDKDRGSVDGVFDYVIPERILALGQEAVDTYAAQMAQMQGWYNEWMQRLGEEAAEDARFVLPNAAATRITMTMNARELRHFFSLRCCNRAQWEIRALANRMLELVLPIAPTLFGDAGAACIRGTCPEGARSCGKAVQMREERERRLADAKERPSADE